MDTAMQTDAAERTPLKTSSLFDDPAASVVFQSSDGVLFRIFGEHLKSTTEGFPDTEHIIPEESSPVILQEKSDVLELLFQFVHPPTTRAADNWRQPNVNEIDFDLFFALAEAAEKYVVFGAMNICFTRMDIALYRKMRTKTLNHAYRHGYVDLADKAAKRALEVPLVNVARILSPDLLARFIIYRDHWEAIVRAVVAQLSASGSILSGCHNRNSVLISYTEQTSRSLLTATSIPPKPNVLCKPSCVCHHFPNLQRLAAIAAEQIPPFSNITIDTPRVSFTKDLLGWADGGEV